MSKAHPSFLPRPTGPGNTTALRIETRDLPNSRVTRLFDEDGELITLTIQDREYGVTCCATCLDSAPCSHIDLVRTLTAKGVH